MKKWISKLLTGTLLIIVFLSLIFVGLFYKHHYHYYERVVGDVCIQQRVEQNLDNYDVVSCSSNDILVKSVTDWIIDGGYIYGSSGHLGYSIHLEDNKVSNFSNLDNLDNFIDRHGLLKFRISNTNNISDLRYKKSTR